MQVFLKLCPPTTLTPARRLERYIAMDSRAARRANQRAVASLAVTAHRVLARYGKVGA